MSRLLWLLVESRSLPNKKSLNGAAITLLSVMSCDGRIDRNETQSILRYLAGRISLTVQKLPRYTQNLVDIVKMLARMSIVITVQATDECEVRFMLDQLTLNIIF